MHVYLAGPMRGYDQFNFPAFRKGAEFLRGMGFTVTSPAEMDEELGFDANGTLEAQAFDLHAAMRRDFQIILDADGIALLEGWERSTGARAERFVAEQCGRKVLYLKPCGGSYTVVDAPEWNGDPRVITPGWFERRDVDDLAGAIRAIEEEGLIVIGGPHDMDGPGNEEPSFAERNESFNVEQQKALSRGPSMAKVGEALATYMEAQPGSFVAEARRTVGMAVVEDHLGLPRRDTDATVPYVEGEVRVVDPDTGGEKGSKLARYDLIPADVLEELAEHYGRGARKYADRNWEKGYAWSLSYAALMRHLQAFWQQEDIDHDPVIGDSPHIIAVVWHAMALAAFSFRHDGTDDRP